MGARGLGRDVAQVVAACFAAWVACGVPAASARDAAALDTAYASRGFATSAEWTAVALTPDGGALVAEPGFALTRLDGDGRPVASFGVAGTAASLGVDATPRVLALASDGSVFIVGAHPPNEILVARVSPAGFADPQFGIARLWSPSGRVIAALATSDGGVLVAMPGGVRRVRPDGTVDGSFGDGGIALASANLTARRVGDLVAAGRGRALVISQLQDGIFMAGVVVSRLAPDGRLDATFGDGGQRVIEGVDVAQAALGSDGTMLVVSQDRCIGARNAVCRGEILRRLDDHGRTVAARHVAGSAGSTPSAIAQDPAGRVLISSDYDAYAGGGTAIGAGMVVRLDRGGRRDRHFGRCGAGAPRTGQLFATRTMAVAPSGRILQAGSIYMSDRFNPGPFGIVIAAQRGGRGAHARIGRPTIDPSFAYRAGSLRHGVVVRYASPVQAVLDVRIADSRGRLVARGGGRVAACTTARFRVRFTRRPHDGRLLLHATARGRGRPRSTIEGACVGRRGEITTGEPDRLSRFRCTR
jgi:hypothetical protein